MKRRRLDFQLLLAAVFAICMPHTVVGQDYSIDWYAIDGGGRTISTGEGYSVSGTIGQPVASTTPIEGGPFSLTSGFLSLNPFQPFGSPLLTVELLGTGEVTLSWDPNDSGWILQETVVLNPLNWINSASGSKTPVTIPYSGNSKFFRLRVP